MTRPWLAPSAARMANSRLRPVDRASSRLATLTQAISNTNPTAANSTRRNGRMSRTMTSLRRDANALVFVRVWIGRGETLRYSIHVRASLGQRDVGPQPRDGKDSWMEFAIAHPRVLVSADGNEDVARPKRNVLAAKIEILRNHAHNDVVGTVKVDGFTKDVR